MENIAWSVPEVKEEELAEIISAFRSDWLTMGPKVSAFENAMAGFLNVPHAIAVSNGSIAIDIVLQILGVGHGDEVIVPTMTYFATAAAVSRVGGIPVFVDVEEATGNLDPERLEAAISKKTKAVIFIDYGGNPAQIDEIKRIGNKHGLKIIQDAAQSLGGIYKGQPLGGQAIVSTMSFHMAKIMTTVEGGMIFTHDERIASEARIYRNQGESAKYKHARLGTNARMTDLNAGIGLAQFKKLPWMLTERARVAARYSELFSDNSDIRPLLCTQKNCSHANFLYAVSLANRDEVARLLREAGIDTRICYPVPLYDQEVYKSGHAPSRMTPSPNAEQIARTNLALPIFPSMTDAQIERVANSVKKAVR